MGQFAKWLLHEDQKELFDYLYALVLTVLFVAITALVLWPLDQTIVTWRLVKGYWVFFVVMILTSIVVLQLQRILRIDMYSHYDAYVISGLLISGVLQAGWSAYVALVVHTQVAETTLWVDVVLYVVGLLASYVACAIVGAFYMGHIYKLVNLPLAILSFIVFSIWPAAARAIFGWFFNLFW